MLRPCLRRCDLASVDGVVVIGFTCCLERDGCTCQRCNTNYRLHGRSWFRLLNLGLACNFRKNLCTKKRFLLRVLIKINDL